MSYNRDDFVKIKAEFSQKYIAARERATAKRTELHSKFPRIWEIDRLLARTGMDIMGIITKGGKNTDGEIRLLRERNERLLSERGEILTAAGYPADYSDIKYDCELCGDTGYVGTTMCECMKRALVMAGYESSGLGALIGRQTFENFSLDYYSANPQVYENMSRSVEYLKIFSEKFDGKANRNFLFVGGTGLGKTHLSTAVAKRIIDRGYDVLYVTAVGMVSDFEAVRFGDGSRAKNDPDRYTEAELLIIDDLGTEVINQFTVSCLYDVINGRINAGRSTIINTNLTSKDIEAKYNERIYSRIIGEYMPIMFAGKDIRRQKIAESK